jgi:hypothetical protein
MQIKGRKEDCGAYLTNICVAIGDHKSEKDRLSDMAIVQVKMHACSASGVAGHTRNAIECVAATLGAARALHGQPLQLSELAALTHAFACTHVEFEVFLAIVRMLLLLRTWPQQRRC